MGDNAALTAFVGLFEPGCEGQGPSSLPPEPGDGNIEYKLKLVNPTKARLEHLITQLKWRLREGQGEAIYEIGVEDCGLLAGLSEEDLTASLATLRLMADRLGASISVIRERVVDVTADGRSSRAAEVLIRKVPDDQNNIELRVAVLGNMDTGKSTLLGVLTQGELDNGRGRARLNLFRHLHEIQSGRTSSISHEIMGFDSEGKVVNYSTAQTAEEICDTSAKLLTFIDLAGHHKYLKTTIFGLTGYCPHVAMLLVSAPTGMAGTAREHLGLALALEVPVFIVVSKIDLCSTEITCKTISQLETLLKSSGVRRVPIQVKTADDALTAASNLTSDNVTPIFQLSSVSGTGLELLTTFLNILPSTSSTKELEKLTQLPAEFQVDEIFHISGVGLVVFGLLAKGLIRENDALLLGPTNDGNFLPVKVLTIHRNKAPCRVVRAGQAASLSLGDFDQISVRKGMMLLCPTLNPQACMYFQASIYVLYHTTAICKGFQTTVYINNVMQTMVIEAIMAKCGVQTNEHAVVMCRFLKHPEHLHVGSRLLFREGTTKGIGHVMQVFPLENNADGKSSQPQR